MVTLPDDYHTRAAELRFATPTEVQEALTCADTVVIDVRSPAEIASTGHLGTPKLVTSHCHDCPNMDKLASQMIPTKDTTVVIYCASGRRAVVAKKRLEGLGYTNVLNAGGLRDVLALLGQ